MAETKNAAETSSRGYRKSRRGYVVSDKMNKTIVVLLEDRVKHPLYGKVVTQSKNCLLYTSPSPRDRQKSRMPSSA